MTCHHCGANVRPTKQKSAPYLTIYVCDCGWTYTPENTKAQSIYLSRNLKYLAG